MKKSFLFLAVLGLVASCSSDGNKTATDANTLTSNDFESIVGWVPDAGVVSKDRAHSGNYSLKVDANREFSLTYDAVLGQVSPRKVKKVHLEGWVFMPSDKATGALALQLSDPDHPETQGFNDAINLGEVVKEYNKWVKVGKDITLPDNITATEHIKAFLWRASATDPVYLDDFSLTVVE